MSKISVIVPVYNVEKYLHRCIESIVNQTYKNIEIILVDDGSTDGSGKICDEYAENDDRVKVIHTENGGVSKARNIGLDAVRGKYVAFVDSDDYLKESAFEILVKKIEEEKADIIYFNYNSVYSDAVITPMNTTGNCKHTTKFIKEKLLLDEWLNSLWDKFYRAELFEGVRCIAGMNFEDAYIMPQIILRANKIVCISDYLYFYNRANYDSITNNINSKDLYSIFRSWNSHCVVAQQLGLGVVQEYCNIRQKKFACESYYLNCLDEKLRDKDISYLEEFFSQSTVSINRRFSKYYGVIVKLKFMIKTILKRNPLIYSMWMKYKCNNH